MFNLNSTPYFDDYVGEKKFHRILFKPGRAVQARELTQLQTILQEQVKRFGNSIFKQGTVITGCAESHNFGVPYVKVLDGVSGNLSDYIGRTVAATNGVSAIVKAVAVGSEAQTPYLNTLYVQYTSNDEGTGVISSFVDGDVLSVDESPIFTVATEGTGEGSLFELGDGIIYVNGHFVLHTDQIILLSPYSSSPTQNVGFVLQEEIVTSDDDATLLDPASGSFNETAPGADRYKLSTVLTSYDPVEAKPDGFFLLFEVEAGVIKRRYDKTAYSELGIELAQRTYDESGDYTIQTFPLFVSEHLNDGTNHGKYSIGGDPSLLVVGVEPGKAYVRGYEHELFATEFLTVQKAIDTRVVQNEYISTAYGNYLIVADVAGPWKVNTGTEVELHNAALNAVTGTTYSNTSAPGGGTKIGTAKFRNLKHISGTAGSATAQYGLYLYDIVLTSGSFGDVRSVFMNDTVDSFADVVTTPASLTDTKYASLLFPLTHDNAKTLDDTSFVGVKSFTQTVANDGRFDVSTVGTDTWGFSAATDELVLDNIVVICDSDFTGGSGYKKGQILDVTGGKVTWASNTLLQFALGVAVTGSPTVTVLVNVKSLSGPNAKTLLEDRYIRINTNTNAGGTYGPWLVGVHDVFSIDKVFVSVGDFTTVAPSTLAALEADPNWEDRTDEFTLSSGTLDNLYGLDSITSASSFFNKSIIVKFAYFNHSSSSGYYTVDSYPLPTENSVPGVGEIAWHEIPKYTTLAGVTYNLRDIIDFRPSLQNSTGAGSATTPDTATVNPVITTSYVGGVATPDPAESFIADIEYHLSRIDRIVLGAEGEFSVVRGIPSDNPIATRQPNNTMTLGYVDIPAYPSLSPYFARLVDRPEYSTNIILVDNRRFTMKDIGSLEARVNRLEYRESLSALEQSAEALQILDNTGVNRHKNGILVDAFLGHNVGNVYDNAYNCSIANGELRPAYDLDNIALEYDANSQNIVRKADDVAIVVRQLVGATAFAVGDTITSSAGGTGTLVHVALMVQDSTYKWTRLYLHDASGTFADTNGINGSVGTITYTSMATSLGTSSVASGLPVSLRPSLVVWAQDGKLVTLPYTHSVYTQNPFASQTRNCASNILFTYEGSIELTPNVDTWMDTAVHSEVQLNTNNFFDNWKILAKAWKTQWNSWRTLWQGKATDVAVPINTDLLSTALTSEQRQIRDGIALTTRLDMPGNVIPFIRSSVVTFSASRLKPNTSVYAFFDGVNVTSYCKNDADLTYGTSPLISDASGNIVGQFRIPAETFTVGTKHFVLTDNSVDPKSTDMTVTASAAFTASGFTTFEQRSILSTQKPEVTFNRARQTKSLVVDRQVTTGSTFDSSDPLAQTFFISNEDNGILLTKIMLYFQARSQTNGITLQIREVVNGYPTDTIIPFSTVTLQPKDVHVSDDATAATEFRFASPVYLKNNTEYCFVLIPTGNDNSYLVWESMVGQQKIGTSEIIDKQPNAGSLFAVSNNRKWTEFINEDLKFEAYAATFTPNVSGTLLLSNNRVDYLTLTPSSPSAQLYPGDTITGDGAGNGVGTIRYLRLIEGAVNTYFAHVALTSGSFASSETANGGLVAVVREKQSVNAISPTLSHLAFSNVGVDWTYRIYDSDGTSYTSTFEKLDVNGTTELTQEKALFSTSEYGDTLQIRGILSTAIANMSPVIDLSKTACVVISNLLNNDVTDEGGNSGNALSKYITRTVVLDDGQDAEDIRVYLSAFLPSNTQVKVYAKLLNASDSGNFEDRPWALLSQHTIQTSSKYDDYWFSPTPGGSAVFTYIKNGVEYNGFRTFAVKVVLLGDDSIAVPHIRDLRVIALLT